MRTTTAVSGRGRRTFGVVVAMLATLVVGGGLVPAAAQIDDADDRVVLSTDYVNVAPRLVEVDGEPTLEIALVQSEAVAYNVAEVTHHRPEDVVIHVASPIATTIPTDRYQWNKVGEPGAPFWETDSTPGDGRPVLTFTSRSLGTSLPLGQFAYFSPLGLRGPGSMAGMTGRASALSPSPSELFASRQGFGPSPVDRVSRSRLLGTPQFNLGVTAEGAYCLDLEVAAPATGAAEPATAQIAIVVGGTDPQTDVCDEPVPPQPGTRPGPDVGAPDEPIVLDDGDFTFLSGHLTEDGFKAGVQRSDSEYVRQDAPFYGAEEIRMQVASPVATHLPVSEGWQRVGAPGAAYWEMPDNAFGVNTAALVSQEAGQLRYAFTRVRGPGHVAMSLTSAARGETAFQNNVRSTAEGVPTTTRETGTDRTTRYWWGFTAPGPYCIDIELSTLRTGGDEFEYDTKTLVIAVGADVDPMEIDCDTLPEPEPMDPVDVSDPANNIIHPPAHSDVSPRLVGNNLELHYHETSTAANRRHHFANTVLHAHDNAQRVVPEPSPGRDYTLLGEPGSTFWRLPGGGAVGLGLIWLGYSSGSIHDEDYQRLLNWRIDGVSGIDGGPPPGDFFFGASTSEVGYGASPIFSTGQGLPMSRQYLSRSNNHRHASWDFTAPGTYCIAMSIAGRLASTGASVSSQQVMTVVVGGEAGSLEVAGVPTCMQAGVNPAGTHPRDPERAEPGGDPVVINATSATTGFADLSVSLEDGDLRVDLVAGSQTGPGTAYDPDDVVFAVSASTLTSLGGAPPWLTSGGSVYRLRREPRLGVTTLGWDLDRIAPSDLNGDVTWRLVDVDGPGELVIADGSSYAVTDQAVLSNRPGHAVSEYRLWPRTAVVPEWLFSRSGVYCVEMEWSATTAAGAAVSESVVMTFAVGVDPSGVELCAEGGTGGDGGGDGDGGDGGPGDTRPPSGRTVLDVGHVDVKAEVAAGQLGMVVEDDRATPVVTHDLDEVVFFVAPGAKTPIPGTPVFSFLGASEAWVLPETPDSTLLWPGWDADLGGGATGVSWSLDAVDGPGTFALYQSAGFGDVEVLFNTRDGLPDSFEFSEHAHGSWAFTSDGVYCLDMTMRAVPPGSPPRRDSGTLLVGVGNVDPARIVPSDCGLTADEVGLPAPDRPTPDDPSGPGDPKGPDDPDGPGDPPGEVAPVVFSDAGAGYLFAAEIGWLGGMGITRGCNPPVNDRFCPDDPVTRGQMAAFLTRALGLPRSDPAFLDIEESVFARDIGALAEAGITRGCNPPANDRFCPTDNVTRGQMAAFLYRALAG